jgi:hypothetical protein
VQGLDSDKPTFYCWHQGCKQVLYVSVWAAKYKDAPIGEAADVPVVAGDMQFFPEFYGKAARTEGAE